MPHVSIADPGAAVSVQPGSVVSKVIHRDTELTVTVFGLDAGEGLDEHRTGRVAIVQVLSGHLLLLVDGEDINAGPGFWLQMAPDTPHALRALEPTVMLLTLLHV